MDVPGYKLKCTGSSHSNLLQASMDALNNQKKDLCIITEEGEKIYTQRSLLCIYSSSVAKYLSDVPCCNSTSITIPVSSLAFNNLIKVLINGFVTSYALEQLSDVSKAAKILGIELENVDFGPENDETNLNESYNMAINSSYNMITKTNPGMGQGGIKKKLKKTKTKKDKMAKIKQEYGCDKIEKIKQENGSDKMAKIKQEYGADKSVKIKQEFGAEAEKLLEEDFGFNKAKFMKINDAGSKLPKLKPKCGFCGKMFPDNYMLNRHMMTHTGEKPFACDQCEKSYSRKDKLKVHLNTVHQISLTNSSKKEPIEKSFACDQCEKVFSRKHKLKYHQKIHTVFI